MSIFTIFYRFSRFTHFCRYLHFVAIYALFPQIFFWPKEPSPQHHTFFACMGQYGDCRAVAAAELAEKKEQEAEESAKVASAMMSSLFWDRNDKFQSARTKCHHGGYLSALA